MGERNAILFKTGTKKVHHDEIPDDFFELTINDAKRLMQDAIQTRQQLEETPLLTKAQRELQQNLDKLSRLNKYKQVIIRINFDNELILQGVFRPVEKVQSIKDFIKKFLNNTENDFDLCEYNC